MSDLVSFGFNSFKESLDYRRKIYESGDAEAIARVKSAAKEVEAMNNEALLSLTLEHVPSRKDEDRNT